MCVLYFRHVLDENKTNTCKNMLPAQSGISDPRICTTPGHGRNPKQHMKKEEEKVIEQDAEPQKA